MRLITGMQLIRQLKKQKVSKKPKKEELLKDHKLNKEVRGKS